MNRFLRRRDGKFGLEQQRATVGVPETVLRVHKDAERRRPQPLGAHRPLLEREIWFVGGRDSAGAEFFRDLADDFARPGVEGIFQAGRLGFAPAQEVRPWRWACLADEEDGPGGSAGGTNGRIFRVKIEAAAQDETVPRKCLCDFGTNPAG